MAKQVRRTMRTMTPAAAMEVLEMQAQAESEKISLTKVIQGSYWLMPEDRAVYIKRETDRIFGKVSK